MYLLTLEADAIFNKRNKILKRPSQNRTKWKPGAVKYLKRGVQMKTEATTVIPVTPNLSPPSQRATLKLWEPNVSPEEHHLVCHEQWISGCFKKAFVDRLDLSSKCILIGIGLLSLITINGHRKTTIDLIISLPPTSKGGNILWSKDCHWPPNSSHPCWETLYSLV